METLIETMGIEAFEMGINYNIHYGSVLEDKWNLDRIDLTLERKNVTKFTVQLDDKSVLEVNDLHRGPISDQKLAIEEYKLEQKELFSQFKKDLKSIAEGQGVWLSS